MVSDVSIYKVLKRLCLKSVLAGTSSTMKFSSFISFVSGVFAAVLSTAGADHTVIELAMVKTCNIDDLACLKKSTELFLKNTYMGIPAFDIVTIDPLSIPVFDVKMDGDNVVYENRNITVKGMKNQELLDYKMDLKAKSVKLTTVVDLTIDGAVTAVFEAGKRISGHSSSRGRVQGTVSYNYKLKKDDKGIEYFEVGPETVACQQITPPNVQYNADLQRALSMDVDASAHASHKHADENICRVAKLAYARAVHNIRAAAKLVPASAFFNNIHGNN